MSNLIKREIIFPENATKEYKEAIIAAYDTPLKEYDNDKLFEGVAVLFHRAKAIAGQANVDENVLEETVGLIVKSIKKGDYRNITSKQLELAIEKGALGEFGEYMGINAKTIHGWIKDFYNYQLKFRRVQTEHEIRAKQEAEQNEKTEYFKQNYEKFMFERFRSEYKNLGEREGYKIYDPNNSFYEYLRGKGLIPKQHPNREEYMDKAKAELRFELKDDYLRAGSNMRTIIQGQLNDLNSTLEGKPKMRARFFSRVCDLILTDYMKGHIELGSSFEEMIED